MALDDHIRILSSVRLFEGFTQDQLRLLAFGAENAAARGGKLYLRGRRPIRLFVVAGQIGLYREQDGERVEITTVGPGAVLGEMALIADTGG